MSLTMRSQNQLVSEFIANFTAIPDSENITDLALQSEKLMQTIPLWFANSRLICEGSIVTLLILISSNYQSIERLRSAGKVSLTCLTAFIFLVLVLPFLFILGAILAIYRQLVALLLHPRELLCGADVMWALDADRTTSREVINALALLEGQPLNLYELKNLVKTKLLPASKKLNAYRAYSAFGYFYWQPKVIDVNSVVRILPHEREEVDEHELRALVSSVSNLPLPGDHAACWELLLGPRVRLVPHGPLHTALIFRVHHALGDGPALCRLLLQTLADQPYVLETLAHSKMPSKLMTSAQRSFLEKIQDLTQGFVKMATLPPDSGPLHSAKELSGHKQLAWSQGSTNLLEVVKDVHRATGAPFTAVLLAALTAAIHEYTSQPTPITLVVPARTPQQAKNATQHQPELDNSFSFALVHLPPSLGDAESEVRTAEAALRSSSRPATLMANSLTLKLTGGLLPRALASQALYSGQCTGVLSNMPGPKERIQLAGRTLQKLNFWVPHRGTTGVGASALSYAGELTLGLMIDEALLKSPDDAHRLTTAWEKHLLRLHSQLAVHRC